MENPVENMDAVGVLDSNIIETIKAVRCHNKKRFDGNIIVEFLCKRYPDCSVTTIRQRIIYLDYKNKILNKTYNDENLYYLIDDSVTIPDDSASSDYPQSKPLFHGKS